MIDSSSSPDLPIIGAQEIGEPRPIARWRWALSLAILGFYPFWMSLISRRWASQSHHGPQLPSSVRGLLMLAAVGLGIFAAFWALGWAFSRASRAQLWLNRPNNWKAFFQGLGYSLGLRFGLGFVLMIAVVLAMKLGGLDAKTLEHLIAANQPRTGNMIAHSALRDPLYVALLLTLISFVVAGLREELWRVATLAALLHLAPRPWNERQKWGFALIISSAIFGLGHIYQGAGGVILTGVVGLALGAITRRHRSVWPAVWTHGFFDACSFALLIFALKNHIALPALF